MADSFTGDLTDDQLIGMGMWDRDIMLADEHRFVGSLLVSRAIAEIRRNRAMVKRLEEWAEELERACHVDDSSYGAHPNLVIAAELRNRMKGE